jgi:uncharacterized DUF497 family protein
MSKDIREFEWDEDNWNHLRHRHPDISVDLAEDIVRSAKQYKRSTTDRYGKVAYGAKRGKVEVWFNIKKNGIARIFSVREVR